MMVKVILKKILLTSSGVNPGPPYVVLMFDRFDLFLLLYSTLALRISMTGSLDLGAMAVVTRTTRLLMRPQTDSVKRAFVIITTSPVIMMPRFNSDECLALDLRKNLLF